MRAQFRKSEENLSLWIIIKAPFTKDEMSDKQETKD